TSARREGKDYVLQLDAGRELRGDCLLVATGRRPRVGGLGLETVGVDATPTGSRGRTPARWRTPLGDWRRQRPVPARLDSAPPPLCPRCPGPPPTPTPTPSPTASSPC